MTHADRLARRLQMARERADGATPAEIARRHTVCVRTVYDACIEANMPGHQVVGRGAGLCKTTLRILAAMEAGEDHDAIARRFNRHHSRIREMYRNAEAAGLAVRMTCADLLGIRPPEPAEKPSERPCGPFGSK